MLKTIMVLTPEGEIDCEKLREMLGYGYELVVAHDQTEARELFTKGQLSAVLCEACTAGGENIWERVFEIISRTKSKPPLIVCSRHADHKLWADVLQVGAHDVLEMPFVEEEVTRVVGNAADRHSSLHSHLEYLATRA